MRRLVRFLVLLFALATFAAKPARAADEPVLTTPRDVPIVLQPARVTLPPLPASFEHRDIGGWLSISFPRGASDRVASLLRDADDIKQRLTQELGQTVLSNVEVRVAHTPEEMTQLAGADLGVPEYASGVAYPSLKLVLLSMQAPQGAAAVDLDEVFRHELAHVALNDAVLDRHVPRWFTEGLAVYESGERSWERTRTLWDASLSGTIMPFAELDRNFPNDPYEVNIAYAESADFVRYLLRDGDKTRFLALVERVRGGQPFDASLADAYATDLHRLEYQWKEEIGHRFKVVPVLTGTGTVGALMAGLLVMAFVKRRRRAKAKLAQWAREEEALDRAIAAEGVPEEEAPLAQDPAIVARRVPMVHHDGRWYTLH